MRKIIYCTLILCFAWISNAYSTPLTAEHLYFFAKQKKLIHLRMYSKYINITNQNNDTALCIAIKNRDKSSFELLRKYGASTHVNCYQEMLNNSTSATTSKTFLGMGKTGWLTTSAVVAVGAGVAAAAGGGGGGGSGNNSSDNTDTPSIPSVPNCVNGNLVNNKCVCNEGWQGNTCEEAESCSYNTTSCSDGYEETGNTCKSGNITYKECKAKTPPAGYQQEECGVGYDTKDTFLSGITNYYKCEPKVVPDGYTTTQCTGGYEQEGDTLVSGETNYYKCKEKDCSGFNYTSCPTGYSQSDFCLSGTETKIKCDNCAEGWIKQDEICYLKLNCEEGYVQDKDQCIKSDSDLVGTTNENNNNNKISIENTEQRNIYGIKNDNPKGNHINSSTNKESHSLIAINNISDGNVYAMHGSNIGGNDLDEGNNNTLTNTISITNKGNGNVYGMHVELSGCGENDGNMLDGYSIENNTYTNTIEITNEGDGNIYAMYGDESDYIFGNEIFVDEANIIKNNATNLISITNIGKGNIYGMYGGNISGTDLWNNGSSILDNTLTNSITINNTGNANVYGMYGETVSGYSLWSNEYSITNNTFINDINIINIGSGYIYGMYGKDIYSSNGKNIYNDISNSIDITSTDGIAFGMYGTNNIYNAHGDTIKIHSTSGTAVGIYGTTGTNITNNGTITITNAETGYGIYHEGNGGSIINSGTIDVSATNAYGIFVEDGTDTIVENTGTIKLNGVECTGDCSGSVANGNYIVLNGAILLNSGTMSANSLNLDNMGGEIVATSSSSFIAEDDISGDLSISNNVVTDGFDTTYTVSDMIKAGDSSKLNLVSKSAMFDASLKNGKDAVMTMKSFNDVVENKSLANFLQKNYAMQNNEKLFSNIKSAENIKSLNNFTDQMFGKDMFSRFAFEDLMIMRELNFDINNKLFNNKEDYLSIGGNKSSFAFSGNSRYSLTSNTVGDYSVGLSVAFSDINSDDGNNDNRRYDKMYNISMPMGYQANGLKFVSTPRVGYSYGTYERNGFDNQTYEGTVEKQMFAFMNEARYPIQVGGWNIAPSAELNFINYKISGHETDKEYSLKIKSQNNYSVEAGIGLYASKESKFSKDSSLRFNGGVALYHEFADPYKMKLGMEGMSGTFTLRDENRSDNRAVVQSEIEFKHNNFSIMGNIASHIDRKYETNTTLDFKFGF